MMKQSTSFAQVATNLLNVLQGYSKTIRLLLVMFLILTASTAWGQTTTTYTFSSKSWAASPANWTSGKEGNQMQSGRGIQVTTGASGANATSPKSFTNVSKIVVTYSTNASAGAGTIKIKIGSNTEVSQNVTTTGGTTDRTLTYNFSPNQTGSVKVTVTCSTNSIYLKSIAITEAAATVNHTVTWNVNGEVYETTQVTEGSKPTFPATPSSCDATSNTFYGWATAAWDGKINDVNGKTIYTSANNMPAVNGAVTYYAVFAEATTTGGGDEEKDFSFNITTADFNTTSYAANNNEKTSTATASDGSTMEVKWTSYQVMLQSSTIQWQKNNGYIYNSTDLGTIKSIDITSTAGTFTTYYGTSKQPSSGTTVGNGYFQIKIGSETGKSSNIKVTFTQTVAGGGGSTTYDNYRTTCTAETSYSVTYNGNGNTSGSVPNDTNSPYKENAEVTVLGNTGNLAKTGYTFSGWNTQTDGSGTPYTAGATFAITENTTLYAQWTAYTINWTINPIAGGSLSATSGNSTTVTPDAAYTYGDPAYTVTSGTATVSQNDNTFSAVPTANSTIQINMVEKPKYTVTLNAGPGTCAASVTEASAGAGVTLPTPTLDCGDWEFAGWKTTSAVTTETTTEPTLIPAGAYSPTSDITLYAVYQRTEGGGGGGEASLTKMVAGNTLSDGDKIVVVANETYTAMYQETIESSYVNKWDCSTLTADVVADDDKNWWTVTMTDGGFYLGDDTNGYLNMSSNNLYCSTNKSVWTLLDLEDGTFKLQSNGRNLSYRSDLTTNPYWRMGGTSYGTAGQTILNLYKYTSAGGGSTTYYHSTPECTTPCEQLGAATGLTVETDFVHTDGKTYVKFSWTPADNTKEYATNQKLCFGKVDEAGTCVDNLDKNLTWTGDLKSKLEPGEYWWSIQALGDGVNYCDGDVVNGTNFTIEAPKASITLSELGVTSTIDTYSVGDQYTLPNTSSQSCDGKQLVGWSTVEVAETDTKPTENYYELDAEVTLAATQTFYAVFATEGEGGGGEYTLVTSANDFTDGVYVIAALDNGTYYFIDGNCENKGLGVEANGLAASEVNNGSFSELSLPSGSVEIEFEDDGEPLDGNHYYFVSYYDETISNWKFLNDDGTKATLKWVEWYDGLTVYTYHPVFDTKTYLLSGSSAAISQNGTTKASFIRNYANGTTYNSLYFFKKTGSSTSYTAYTTSCIPTYSITYNFAGGTGSHCSNTSVPQGAPYTICDEAPTKEGHTFQGWSDGTSTYDAGTTITPTKNITLTAQWQINTYTVIWSNNGTPREESYEHGQTLNVPAPEDIPSCDGVKVFVGWTEDNTFTYHATTPPSDIFTEKTATVTANATYYAVFATKGEGSANFVLGESGTFKMYANVEGTNYYAQGGVSSSKITSTTEAANASDYTLTHKGNNQYTIQLGNAYIGHSGISSTDLNTTETTWTIQEGVNGSWRIVSPVNTSRALAYRASTYKIFKAYSMTSVEAGDTEYYDIEFGGTSSGYSDYTTICQQIESIEVQSPQTEFYLTDEFTIGSGKVIATLSGGGTTDVTALATFSGYNMNVVGTYTVTVTYMGATATYEINVKPLDNAWVLTWNVSGKTNTGLGPRYVTKESAIGTLPTPEVPAACEGKTFMGWTESNIVPSDGVGIEYIKPTTVPTDNTTYYAVFATVNNFCTQKPIDQIASGSKVVIVAVASLTADGGSGKAISSRATDDTYNLQGDDVAIYDQTINTPHSTCIWTITKSGEKYIFTQDGKYLNGIIDGSYSNLKYNSTSDSWSLTPVASGMAMTYNMNSTNASTEYVEWYNGKFTIHNEVNDKGNFDMQFYVTANADGNADITDYTTGCEEYTITYYGFRGGYSTSTSSDGIIVLPVNSMHTVPNCGDVVTDHTNLGRKFLNVWMTQPHGGHTFKPGDTFILTQDTTLYAQWKLETTSDVTTLPTDIEDMAGTDIYVYGGKTLNIQPGTTTINSLTLKGGLQSDGSYKMPIVWVPEGATLVRNSNKIYLDLVVNAKNYYPFAVPFATKNDQYIDYLDPVLNAASTYDKHFVIKTYDGERRAKQGEDRANNWVKVLRHQSAEEPSYLQPGVGYIIQALTYPNKDTATIRIPMTVPNTWFENGEQAVVGTTVRNSIAVTAHGGAAADEHQRHAGWNFVANPYLTSFAGGNVANGGDLAYINGELTVNGGWQYGGDPVPYVTIPAYDFSYYTQHKLGDVKLSPEWSFFVQIGTGGTMNFSIDGRQETPASIAARHDAAQSFKMDVDITLSDKNHSDQMGLIICDRFSSAYEVGYDLEKMFGSAYNLTVYTLMEDNTPLAYHALAIHSNMQVIPVGYRVPEQGDYTFALNQSTSSIDLLNEQYEQLILVDYETGALTNLLNSTYTFTSPRTQSDSRFAIYAVIRQKTPTDLPNIDDGDTSTRKILHNGHLYILRDGKVYNGNGQIVK